jgi:V/A-type H+-transporting ATPase subunit K
MFWILGMMILVIFSTVATGVYLQFAPRHSRWSGAMLGVNALSFVGGLGAMLLLAMQAALAAAEPAAAGAAREITVGHGLAIIGVGLPTAIATISAALAVGPIGSAALAVIAERPDAFGRSLIIIGLAEGIAIYGLVVSILLLDKI